MALIAGITYFVYYYVIGKGEVSLTGTVLAAYPLTTIILSAIFLHEQLGAFQKIAILLAGILSTSLGIILLGIV